MWQTVCEVNKKRFRLVGFDILDGLLGVTPRNGGLVCWLLDNLGISQERHVKVFNLRLEK